MITSPLTDRVDLMLVRTLHHRAALLSNEAENAPEIMKKALKAKSVNLSNRAESFKATFLSIESDRFIETASFLGVPLTFWYGWRKSTEDIDMQLAKQRGRVILFQGQNDTNYSDEDVRKLLRFGKIKDVQLVKVPGADHYLIEKNKLPRAPARSWLNPLSVPGKTRRVFLKTNNRLTGRQTLQWCFEFWPNGDASLVGRKEHQRDSKIESVLAQDLHEN